jgi:pimeloyl-ACP methyl ester carboxylesterase
MDAGIAGGHWRICHHSGTGFSQFYREWLPSDERFLPLLALHGSLLQSGMWISLAEAAGSIRMLCPDQRGFGLSEDPGIDSCAAFSGDAVALAGVVLPNRYVVMGHSFACSIALEVAHADTENVAAVVLVDPVMPAAASRAALAALTSSPPDNFATREDAERHFRDTEEGTWTDAALWGLVDGIMIRDGDSGPWRFPYTHQRLRRLRAFSTSAANDFKLFDKAKAVRCPVLVFRGGMSKRFPPDAEMLFLQQFASKPEFVVCPMSGHFPTATEPAIVVAALKRFLDGLR